ncbi:MAG: glycosyltransferase [Anaerolineae bacterium]|jgi:1,2-diacylglycerol 3-beta-galactosyltransferase|nr:glycosyltransferase [Anaerolineae bacterium]
MRYSSNGDGAQHRDAGRYSAGPRDLPRVTILTANVGGGHMAASRSLIEALDGKAHVKQVSMIDDHAPFPLNTWGPTYAPWVNYTPWLYRLVYRFGASRERIVTTQKAFYPLLRSYVASMVRPNEADLFISVHPLEIEMPLWLMAETGQRVPFATVVTDPVTAPLAWFCPDVDLCVVATQPAYETGLSCGLTPDRLKLIGLPIRRAFGEMQGRDKSDLRARLGLAPKKSLVLMSGGGAGIGRIVPMARAVAKRLAQQERDVQLAIVAGRNKELQRRLGRQKWPIPVRVLGFVDNMAEWMRASDLLLTKAGPGMLAEAACLGLPVVITDFIPGQEIGNVSWVVKNGAGLYEHEIEGIAAVVGELLRPGNPTLEMMSAQARAMARPNASDEIVAATLRLIER